MSVRALPLWQPWASLVVLGAKAVETRRHAPPSTIAGQRVAVYATKSGPSARRTLASSPAFERVGHPTRYYPDGFYERVAEVARQLSEGRQTWTHLRKTSPPRPTLPLGRPVGVVETKPRRRRGRRGSYQTGAGLFDV